jgi:flagellar hook-basal body complex protein FliE
MQSAVNWNTAATQGMGGIGSTANPKLNGAQTPQTPFAGVLKSVMQQTAQLDKEANAAVTGLVSGQGVEIHQAMMATQRAELAFELALQVRNKAVAAYQQMMTMQF